MKDKELLKHLLRFTNKYTNHVDEIIYKSQYGVNPVQIAEQYFEGTDSDADTHDTEASEGKDQ